MLYDNNKKQLSVKQLFINFLKERHVELGDEESLSLNSLKRKYSFEYAAFERSNKL